MPASPPLTLLLAVMLQIPNVVAAAASILLLLEESVPAYEKQFRAEFGNSPDTSKALRL